MRNFANLIKFCEVQIRDGKTLEAYRALGKINSARVPRSWRLPLANLCRRVGLYSVGLSLLSRLVQGRVAGAVPSAAEVAEYSMLLMRSGAVGESLARLEKLDSKEVPAVLLYRSYGLFLSWDYQAAIPLLREYAAVTTECYPSQVAKINLAYANLECGHYRLAKSLLGEVRQISESQKYTHILKICRAMMAHIHIDLGDYPEAHSELAAAPSDQGPVQSHDQFENSKWSLILEGLQNRDLDAFAKLRDLARRNHEWETLREVDFYSLRVKPDTERRMHLFFGTPYLALRKNIESAYGQINRTTYILGDKSQPRFDLKFARWRDVILPEAGGKMHRLIQALLQDFYQQPTVAGLFSKVFPDEYFDIGTSPDRMHQLLRRTRAWLADCEIPLTIEESHGFYKLQINGPASIRICNERAAGVDFQQMHLNLLKEKGCHLQNLNATTVMQTLSVSRATAYRFLRWYRERDFSRSAA